MSNYNFLETKREILSFIKTQNSFDNCFVVRNIFSRFVIYIENSKNFTAFKNEIISKFSEWVDDVHKITEDDTFIYKDLIETSNKVQGSNQLFFSERHVENTNWFIKDQYELKTPVTSFYSFKGGVGRTTAAVLTALLLAREGKKVLLIDFDFEAPGLASIFANEENGTENLIAVKGVIDFLVDYEANKRNIEKINLDEYYFVKNEQELVGKNGGELIVVPAVATDRNSAQSYIDKLSKANLKYGFGKDYILDFFLKEMERKLKPDLIFIDTRTGINDIGGLVFNRYAQSIFLFFYGNQQNMFGLESILPELIELKEKNVGFYLVNSPVPKNPTDERTEIEYFVEQSYELFCENFYLKNDSIPSPFDESAEHFPINIHYNEQALILNNYKKLGSLIEKSDNEYQNIAKIIVSDIEEKLDDKNFIDTSSSNIEVLECIVNIDKGAGTSEVEFQNEDDLTKYFYPRKDYKYIFDETKFLILGEKGVGKTALFSVLSHENYAKALADFCGVDAEEIEDTKWIIGFDKDKPEFPSRENFESLSEFTSSQFRSYWVILLFRQLGAGLIEDSSLKTEIFKSKIRGIKELAKRENIGEELLEILGGVNDTLKNNGDRLIIVYDYLDAVLPSENELRGKLVSALLTFYYDNFNRISNIKAKIFLRQDIFDREVTYITDKVKIQNYSVGIKWDYNQLLNIIWKRLYEQNKELSIFGGLKFPQYDLLGAIPNLQDENEHKLILEKIFGKRMGGNNKAYPYNWVRLRTEDTNNRIHPRTLIKIFSESARLELAEKVPPKDRIIRSKNIETALKDTVSKHQIQELSEEYPELSNVFENLSEKVEGRSPIKEPDLTKALKDLGIKEPLTTITLLKDIGLLKDYKPYKNKNSDDDRRYHIPDLYLFGLNFTRKGAK